METKKVGRPKGPEKTMLRVRVPVGEKEVLESLVDAALDRALGEWQKKNEEYLRGAGWYFDQLEAQKPVGWQETPMGGKHEAILEKGDVQALLEDVGRLSEEIEGLKRDLEDARSNVEGNGAYWRERALKAEARVKVLEQA